MRLVRVSSHTATTGNTRSLSFTRRCRTRRATHGGVLNSTSKASGSGAEIFDPISALGPEMWEQVVTLPASIRTLSSVKYLGLYGSHSVQIPPEIGDLASLEEFDPYTSYRLHWFPYEITRCKKLKRSRVSTRTLYAITNSDRPFLVFPII